MKQKKRARRTVKRWSSGDMSLLRQMAGRNTLKQISTRLKRTTKAVEQKASTERISLRRRVS
jgi:hypothetical protein